METTTDDRRTLVFLGVDTHSDAHVGVVLDEAGRRIGELSVPNSEAGYAELVGWVLGLGDTVAAGVEGTGSYGAGGLSRFLRAKGLSVVEVNRTSRQHEPPAPSSVRQARRERRRGRGSAGSRRYRLWGAQGRRRGGRVAARPARSL